MRFITVMLVEGTVTTLAGLVTEIQSYISKDNFSEHPGPMDRRIISGARICYSQYFGSYLIIRIFVVHLKSAIPETCIQAGIGDSELHLDEEFL